MCTRTQHVEQLTRGLVPSLYRFGVDSCPSELPAKHISGIRGFVLAGSSLLDTDVPWIRVFSSLWEKNADGHRQVGHKLFLKLFLATDRY